jgi:polyhydroxybutyrate depolymerase
MNFKTIWAGLPVLCAGVLFAAELKPGEWTIDGVTRQALISAPASAATNPAPLVFAFHGHGGSMQNAARSFRMHEVWPEAVVVYMQGLPTPGQLTDPEGKRNGWQKNAADQGGRDLKFFDAVLGSLQKEYKIDPKRIYATGHSNGGGFTYLLWAERGDVFAAVAPSGALSLPALPKLKPKPVLHLAGEADPLVKFVWQEKMIQAVRKLNGCAESGAPWVSAGDLTGTLYPSATGTPLITLIHPGGHNFPAEAPDLMVRFFKENGRK